MKSTKETVERMDLIAVDVGNSRVSISVFAENELKRSEYIDLQFGTGAKADNVDAAGADVTCGNVGRAEVKRQLSNVLAAFREMCGKQAKGVRTVPLVASSVNSKALAVLEEAADETLKQKVLVVGRDFPLEMKVGLADVSTVGSDRLITAFAAYEVIGKGVVVADFGTATTIDYVNDKGIFLGGVIMPGLNLAAKSLHDYTDALPEVELVVPEGQDSYGVNTIQAIQNGIYYGCMGALREMVERYATEMGNWPYVVATGGFGKLIAQKSEIINSVIPDLCQNGLYLAYRRYRESLGL